MIKILDSQSLPNNFYTPLDYTDGEIVQKILDEIKRDGDKAVRFYTKKFDGVDLSAFLVDAKKIKEAYSLLKPEEVEAIKYAKGNLERFAKAQLAQAKDFEMETEEGVWCGQKVVPIEKVCVYAPGGNFPLPSSVLMGAVPAKVAGCRSVVLTSPPSYHGEVHPAVLVAADVAGVDLVYALGGVQAIGAFAFGTASIPRVDLIVGPGNKYVTLAKKNVYGVVGIDFVAGPSEVMIIADKEARADYIAADMLAQAEHDLHASAFLLTDSRELANKVQVELEEQLKGLKTKEIARESIDDNSYIVLCDDLEQAVQISNAKAPEHLELQTVDNDKLIPRLSNYGSLFIGEKSVEALGDYSAGVNHTLPTGLAARYTAGLSVNNFIKKQTTLRVEKSGKATEIAKIFAQMEGLDAHSKSAGKRLS